MITFADDVMTYVREQHFGVGNDAVFTVGADLCAICNQTSDVCLVFDSAKIARSTSVLSLSLAASPRAAHRCFAGHR